MPTATRKKPAPGAALKDRVAAFFEDNPGEWLERPDAVAKFGCHTKNVDKALGLLIAEGAIEAVRIYRRVQR